MVHPVGANTHDDGPLHDKWTPVRAVVTSGIALASIGPSHGCGSVSPRRILLLDPTAR
jgi:hypothetical protein